MELRDFIAETLSQIVDGVRKAQSGEMGTNVNAQMATADFGGHLVNMGTYGVATRVDFDVSISAESSGNAGAKLTVFGVGVGGGADHKAASANRISFSVPVRLPDGDSGRANRIQNEEREQWAQVDRQQRRDYSSF